MIKNDRQYEYTRKKLDEFKKDLRGIRGKYPGEGKKEALLCKGYLEHIAQLEAEIEEYRKMKKTPLPKVLRARSAGEISRQLVRLRIARKLTQAELAARIGCKQADVSRLEREDYQGYTIGQLRKVATGLDAEIELDIITGAK